MNQLIKKNLELNHTDVINIMTLLRPAAHQANIGSTRFYLGIVATRNIYIYIMKKEIKKGKNPIKPAQG